MPTKTRLLLLASTLLLTAGAFAQGLPPAGGAVSVPQAGMRGTPPSPQMELAQLTQQLTLTDAQQAAILPILTQRREALDALRKNGNGTVTREANMQQMHVIFDSTNAQIRPLLTESQTKLFDAMQPPPPPGGGPQTPTGGTSPEANPSTGTPKPAPPQN